MVDEERNIAITEKILFAGVQFKNTRDCKGDFENTDLYYYMDTYFSKEIISNNIKINYLTFNKQKQLCKRI